MKRTGSSALIVIALLIGCAAELENPEDFMNPGGAMVGAGATGAVGSGATGAVGSGATGATGAVGGGGGGSGGMAGAPPCDAPTLVFNVPDTMGGCQGAVCHMGIFAPELHTPGVAARLLDEEAVFCPTTFAPPLPKYIDSANPANSFILNKVQAAMPTCGEPMPYMPNGPLSAEKMACLVEWVNSVAAGP